VFVIIFGTYNSLGVEIVNNIRSKLLIVLFLCKFGKKARYRQNERAPVSKPISRLVPMGAVLRSDDKAGNNGAIWTI